MTSPHARQKQTEAIYLERFIDLAGWNVTDVVSGESPDFTFRIGIDLVGVEITELLKGSGQAGSRAKRDEQRRQRVVRRIARDYYAAGGAPAIVRAIWPDGRPSAPESLAQRLRREREGLQDSASVRIDLGRGEVYHLTSLPAAAGEYAEWKCVSDSVGWVAEIDSEALRTAVEAKGAKVTSYRDKAQRVVLLVVADQRLNSGKWRLSSSFRGIDASGFDEVHLLMYPDTTQRVDLGAAF